MNLYVERIIFKSNWSTAKLWLRCLFEVVSQAITPVKEREDQDGGWDHVNSWGQSGITFAHIGNVVFTY